MKATFENLLETRPITASLAWILPVALLSAGLDLHAGKGGGGKPGGGGGGEDSGGPCVDLVPFPGASILNDDSDGIDPGTPYCDDKKAKVSVIFTQDGHMSMQTNSSSKGNTGRDLYIDFGVDIDVYTTDGDPVADPDDPGQQLSFQNTNDLNDKGIDHEVNLLLGAFQDDFNLFEMEVDDTHIVNLTANLMLRDIAPVFIKAAPVPLENMRHCPGSDGALVTRTEDVGGKKQWLIQSYDLDTMTVGPAEACVSHYPFAEAFRDPVVVPDRWSLLEFAFVLGE